VPFRLTRNFQKLFNGIAIDGIFNGVMTAAAMCLSLYKEQLRHQLVVYLREEFFAWQCPEELDTPPENRKPEAEMEWKRLMKAAVEINSTTILERIKALGPPPQPDKSLFLIPINKKISQLIDVAQDQENISQMDPTWSPWI